MNGSEFSFFLPPLTAHVARIIAERHGWDEETAFEGLVESDLYALLEEPKTEVWHYSPLMLAMMFDSECEGHLEFPEVRRWTTASCVQGVLPRVLQEEVWNQRKGGALHFQKIRSDRLHRQALRRPASDEHGQDNRRSGRVHSCQNVKSPRIPHDFDFGGRMGRGCPRPLTFNRDQTSPWNSFMLLTPSFWLLATWMDPTAISAPWTVVMKGISSSTASLRMV